MLLLVSGVYYPVEVLPGLDAGDGHGLAGHLRARGPAQTPSARRRRSSKLWGSIWPLLIMGVVFVPLGLFVFHLGESYAKRTGKLKRSG